MNRSHLFVFLGLVVAFAMLLPVAAGVNTHSVNSQQYAVSAASTTWLPGNSFDGNGTPPPPFPQLGFDGNGTPPPPFPQLAMDGNGTPPPPFPQLGFDGNGTPPPPFPQLAMDGNGTPPPPFPQRWEPSARS